MVAKDHDGQQQHAVPKVAVEQRKPKSQELEIFGILADGDLLLVNHKSCVFGDVFGSLIVKAHPIGKTTEPSLFPVGEIRVDFWCGFVIALLLHPIK